MINGSRCFVRHAQGLFDPDMLLSLRSKAEIRLNGWSADQTNKREVLIKTLGTMPDRIRLDQDWVACWRRDGDGQIQAVYPYTFVTYPVQIRNICDVEQLVPWHQDVGYLRLLGNRRHSEVITCFTPIELNPSQTSSIEIALGEFGDLEHSPAGPHGASIPDFAPEKTVRFDLKLGDAIIFGDHTPHRTITGPNGRIARWSFEFRLVRPQDSKPGRDYFNIENGEFIHITEAMPFANITRQSTVDPDEILSETTYSNEQRDVS